MRPDTGLILLSHPIEPGMAVYPGAPSVSIDPHRLVARGDPYNSYAVQLFNHCGTHADAPAHVYEQGPSLADFAPEDLVFRSPHVVTVPASDRELISPDKIRAQLGPVQDWDFLAIRTGFGRHRVGDPARFAADNPGLSPEAARWLIEEIPSLRCLGLDVISVTAAGSGEAGWNAHRILLDPSDQLRLVVEEMVLPPELPLLSWVWVIPLQVKGVDSSWCTVVAQPAPEG